MEEKTCGRDLEMVYCDQNTVKQVKNGGLNYRKCYSQISIYKRNNKTHKLKNLLKNGVVTFVLLI